MSPTPAGFDEVFAALKQLFRNHLDRLRVQSDSATEYTLVGRKPSPFPQHKGHPMYFGAVRLGKAYVSFHLLPLCLPNSSVLPTLASSPSTTKTGSSVRIALLCGQNLHHRIGILQQQCYLPHLGVRQHMVERGHPG